MEKSSDKKDIGRGDISQGVKDFEESQRRIMERFSASSIVLKDTKYPVYLPKRCLMKRGDRPYIVIADPRRLPGGSRSVIAVGSGQGAMSVVGFNQVLCLLWVLTRPCVCWGFRP